MAKNKLTVRKVAVLHAAALAANRFSERALSKMFTHHWWRKMIVKIVPNMNRSYMTVLFEGQVDSNLKEAHKIEIEVLMWVNGFGVNWTKTAMVSIDGEVTKFWAEGDGNGNDLRRIEKSKILPAECALAA